MLQRKRVKLLLILSLVSIGVSSHNTFEVNGCLPNFFTTATDNKSEYLYHQLRYENAVSVFQHVHKSGGIMVRRFLEAIASHKKTKHSQKLIAAGLTAPSRLRMIRSNRKNSLTATQIIHGDHAFRYCDYFAEGSGTCAYWIMLRDPIERIISDYNYCVNRGNSWGERLKRFRLGRGDHLCTTSALFYFNRTDNKPTLADWVS